MHIAFLCIVLSFGLVYSAAVGAMEIPSINTKDVLVTNLNSEIAQFLKKGKISEWGRKQVSVLQASFKQDPLLKAVRGIREDRKVDMPELKSTKKELAKIVEASLRQKQENVDNCWSPLATPDLAHDFLRLKILEGVFKKEGFQSRALGPIIEKVITEICETTTS